MHRVHPHTIRCTREHQNAFCALTTGTRMKKKIAKCIHVRKMQSYPGLVNIKWNLLLTFFVHSPFFAADAVAVAASFQFFVFLYAILADIAGMFAEIEALEINGPSEESHVRKKNNKKTMEVRIYLEIETIVVVFLFLTFYHQPLSAHDKRHLIWLRVAVAGVTFHSLTSQWSERWTSYLIFNVNNTLVYGSVTRDNAVILLFLMINFKIGPQPQC